MHDDHGHDDHDHHGHSHGHAHGHARGAVADAAGRVLLWTMLLNLLIPACQIVGGLFAGSMALISDAVHNLSDFTALAIAYAAHRLAKRGPSLRYSFGLIRAELMAALINTALLVGASAFILFEAIGRLLHPEPVAGGIVAVLAGVGVVGNGLSALLLHGQAGKSLNLRGAFLHMLGDLLTSVAVLANGLVLLFFPAWWLDPLLSVLIVAFIVKSGLGVAWEATHVLMEGVPAGMDMRRIRDALQEDPEVAGVHHLHVWSVGAGRAAMTCHVVVSDRLVSATEPLAARLRQVLLERFGISHALFQFEHAACGDNELFCVLETGKAPKSS